MKVKILTTGEHIEEVSSFKYFGMLVHGDGPLNEKSGQRLN